MCLRVLRDALVSQVEYFRLRRSRATASAAKGLWLGQQPRYTFLFILIYKAYVIAHVKAKGPVNN